MSEQQQPQLYQYSVKIEMTAKGLAMPTIHVYSSDMETARKQAVEQYAQVIEELKGKGLPVAAPDFKTYPTILSYIWMMQERASNDVETLRLHDL